MDKTYDSKCYELAEYFLQDEKGLTDTERKLETHLLAQEIQQAIEDFLNK